MSSDSSAKGFTLLEILVAISLFLVVVFIAVNALFVIADAHKRTQATRRIIDNVDFALADIVRGAQKGRSYHCGKEADFEVAYDGGTIGSSQDCQGGDYLAFEAPDGDPDSPYDQIVYRYSPGALEKSTDGGLNFIELDEPDVTIDNLKIFVSGSDPRDQTIARLRIVLETHTHPGTSHENRIEIKTQTSVTQRFTDL